MLSNAQQLIASLELMPHPEGGFYKETYRSDETTITPNGYSRNICTAIYFLLEGEDKSHFHRIKSDELWFFHMGQPLEIVFISDGELKRITLGNNTPNGELLFYKVPANTWFGSKVKHGKGFSLVSCTVAPGFDFADFEMARREDLIQQFPYLKSIIEEFTRI